MPVGQLLAGEVRLDAAVLLLPFPGFVAGDGFLGPVANRLYAFRIKGTGLGQRLKA